MEKILFTSESVTEGHPDKICDQISDAILDAIILQDPFARVACETTTTTGLISIMGEITTNCYVDIPKIARNVVREIGYTNSRFGFDADSCSVITSIDEQSKDIAQGVDHAENYQESTGAGDQGMMFGFACDETDNYMPMSIDLAHSLSKQLTKVRKDGVIPYLGPDGKTQVTLEYENNNIKRIDTIVISTQHEDNISLNELREDIKKHVIYPIVPKDLIDEDTKFLINPTGRFVVGGPQGDSGLTGRKIIVDTYGGVARHGGGAFSGKDCTKVDRSAAYAARYVAKNIVAAKLAKKCEIQLAYAIGVAEPVSVRVDTFNTSTLSESALTEIVRKVFDLSVDGIINTLDLRKPIYRQLAAYGHMGRTDLNVSFEKLDKVDVLIDLANQYK